MAVIFQEFLEGLRLKLLPNEFGFLDIYFRRIASLYN